FGFWQQVRATPAPSPKIGHDPSGLERVEKARDIRWRTGDIALRSLPSQNSKPRTQYVEIYTRDAPRRFRCHNDVLKGHSSRSRRLYVRERKHLRVRSCKRQRRIASTRPTAAASQRRWKRRT